MPTLAEPLPKNAVLLHIGPHKTGTSAVQAALNAASAELAQHAVVHLGRRRYREQAPLGALGLGARTGVRTPTRGDWTLLVQAVARHPDRRVVLSSERYCWADYAAARSIVEDLGGDRVHVVITLRPLDRILASQWQMSVQGGLTSRYEDWLRAVFAEGPDPGRTATTFWKRQDHGDLVSRWSKAAGEDHLTVIVVDESDRSQLMRAFAALLDVPPDLLVPVAAKSNRSLTAGEVELVRRVNEAFAANGWTAEEQVALVRRGLSRALVTRKVGSAEPRITTPRWAREAAHARAETAISEIRALGVPVIGSLDALRVDLGAADQPDDVDEQVPAEAAALAVMGALERVPVRTSARPSVPTQSVERLPDRLVPIAIRWSARLRRRPKGPQPVPRSSTAELGDFADGGQDLGP